MTQQKTPYTWYTRHDGEIKGPFTVGMIRKFVLVGRLSQDDEVSSDQKRWQALRNVDELIPDVMRNLQSEEDYERLMLARRHEDERVMERRLRANQPDQDKRRAERRSDEDIDTLRFRALRHQQGRDVSSQHKGLWWLTGLLAVLIALVLIQIDSREPPLKQVQHTRDCLAEAGPGVDWRNCPLEGGDLHNANLKGARMDNARLSAANLHSANLQQAQMAYANLSGASLQYADMRGARLVGAALRKTDMRYADLSGADLGFADMRGADLSGAELANARLDKAIWIDGRVCQEGSLGECR